MQILTGQTIYENVVSLDSNNNPISAATIGVVVYKNSQTYEMPITSGLTDAKNAVFTFSFSAETTGYYQMYIDNRTTNTIYMSETYQVISDDQAANVVIYAGL